MTEELKNYIESRRNILIQLGVPAKLVVDAARKFSQCTNEIQVDNIMKHYRNIY